MSIYEATIIKTGNSYALRVPKAYIDDSNLSVGQKVSLNRPLPQMRKHDPEGIRKAMAALAAVDGALAKIQDPVAWQREIRRDRPLPGRE